MIQIFSSKYTAAAPVTRVWSGGSLRQLST